MTNRKEGLKKKNIILQSINMTQNKKNVRLKTNMHRENYR